MLVVLAIMALIGGIGFPRLQGQIAAQEWRTSVAATTALLRGARAQAMRQGAPVAVGIGPGGTLLNAGATQLALPAGVAAQGPSRLRFYADGSSDGGEFAVTGDRHAAHLAVAAPTGLINGARTMTRRGGETGTMIVEAMVAVLIVSLMAGLWFQTVAGTTARERGLADRRTALLVAQSQLATVGVLHAVVPGTTTGRDGRFAWRIAIDGAPDAGAGIARVTVTVDGDGEGNSARRLASLETLRFGG